MDVVILDQLDVAGCALCSNTRPSFGNGSRFSKIVKTAEVHRLSSHGYDEQSSLCAGMLGAEID
jgi:hypothetical protein